MGWFWGNSDDSSYCSSYYTSEEEYSEEEGEEGDEEEYTDEENEQQQENAETHSAEEQTDVVPRRENGAVLAQNGDKVVETATTNGTPSQQQQQLEDEVEIPPPPSVDTGNLKEDEFNQLLASSSPQQEQHKQHTQQQQSVAQNTVQALADASIEDDDDSMQEQEPATATSTSEKQSLLLLAAEHDRVDILNTILEESKDLLNPTNITPPLHVAVLYGSVNAVNCLLRMGADPSLRPAPIDETQQEDVPLDLPKLQKFVGKTAWELANNNTNSSTTDNNHGSWSGLFRSPSGLSPTNNVAPSKQQNIQNSFTMEALRALGSDEEDRLQQLLDSGMPTTIEVGEKSLLQWAADMDATNCQALLAPDPSSDQTGSSSPPQQQAPRKSIVVGDPSSLRNKLEELSIMAKALSTFLDNLAEEVSVCSGLLLVGSGAAALASHVKSLRVKKETLLEKLERHNEAYSNSNDELNYWIQQCGGSVDFPKFKEPPSLLEDAQLEIQIAASETKIRKLRASIADLSEENARNLEAVERRGLGGAVTMVRNLRDEIREIEFCLSEATSGEAACRTRIQYIQSNLETLKQDSVKDENNSKLPRPNGTLEPVMNGHTTDCREGEDDMPESEKIATGQSTAIVLREPGNRGSLPFTIWQILLRIIGLSDPDSTEARPAMII